MSAHTRIYEGTLHSGSIGEAQINADRLLPLPPIGVGTPQVESLSSYVSRVLTVHSIGLKALIDRVNDRFDAAGISRTNQISSESIAYLNGTSDFAVKILGALILLTGQEALRQTTLVHLKPVVSAGRSNTAVLKRRWCVLCYQEMLDEHRDVYDKLLWQVPAVTSCDIHSLELQERCPHCRSLQPICSLHELKWRCAHCNDSLVDYQLNRIATPPAKAPLKMWVNRAVTDLILLSNNAETIRTGAFATFISTLANEYGLISLCESLVGYARPTVLQWRTGRHIPALPTLLDVSIKRNVPPVLVVTSPELAAKISNTLPFDLDTIDIWPTRYRRNPRTTFKHDGAAIKRKAAAVLKRLPTGKWISQQEFARRTGYAYPAVATWASDILLTVRQRNIDIRRAKRLEKTRVAVAEVMAAEERLTAAGKRISRKTVVREAIKTRKSTAGPLKAGYGAIHRDK